ncbi:MAG: hypothetical protein AYP45_03605 [Candidatus Brocadia carolinensis]|uniref:Uncharacterized protein n=1 Tax=Candidatus Brocadia carolinensis TaxID=1004156 RepID=A0A1V4AWF0_9BACT|nr:MAG: hypothetical protein AYP45_03605 [Candidatus Brocadia caroliniensis]
MGKEKSPQKPIDEGKKIFRRILTAEFDNLDKTLINSEDKWKQHILLIDKFKKIYTTNWDTNIENVALQKGPGYKTYISDITAKGFHETRDIRNPCSDSKSELIKIYKYHGCYKEEEYVNSIVASESDYYDRLQQLEKKRYGQSFYF